MKPLIQTLQQLIESKPPESVKQLKPIVVRYYLDEHGDSKSIGDSVISHYDRITLIARNYTTDFMDLFYASNNDDVNDGILMLGHWNDGVVK